MIMVPFWELTLADAIAAASIEKNGRYYRVLILRQITIEPIAPFLVAGGQALGLAIDCRFGGFDTMMQDVLDDALWLEPPDAVLVAPSPTRSVPSLVVEFDTLSSKEILDTMQMVVDDAEMLVGAIRKRTEKPILWLGLYRTMGAALGLADQRNGEHSQNQVLRVANSRVDELLRRQGPGWVVDIEACSSRVGTDRFFDRMRWYRAGTPFTPFGFREIALECLKYFRNVTGALKKVLALDCDYTLWAGLAGEVGYEGVELDPQGYPGAAHLGLQRLAASLKRRGALLVLVSKNEPDSVWQVFDRRSEMILKRQDIVAWRINWEAKADNLIALSEELNLGLDSFVYIDDQITEIEAVRRFCPQVECLHLTERSLIDIDRIFSAAGWFETLAITDVDRERTNVYQADLRRDSERKKSVSTLSYLADLHTALKFQLDGRVNIERAAQMCQRTNQFNLTSRRYTAADIDSFVASKNATVIALSVTDRFGFLGDVGLAILRYEQEIVYIDTLLLSCRAFGRYCENALLSEIVNIAKKRGMKRLLGEYIPTTKNLIVRDYWLKNGFQVEGDSENVQHATLELPECLIECPSIFKSIEIEE